MTCLSRQPSNGNLVQSLFVNGDAAHASSLVTLLKSLSCLRKITFFDFELFDSLHRAQLCASIPQAVTHLDFQVIPAAFLMEILLACRNHIKSLSISRVDLADTADWEDSAWYETLHSWRLPQLENIELRCKGNISVQLFDNLIARNSAQLRELEILISGSAYIASTKEIWKSCTFNRLEALNLGHFQADVIATILAFTDPTVLRTLKLRSFEFPIITGQNDSILHMLVSLPSSLYRLELQEIILSFTMITLGTLLNERKEWLPCLRKLPKINRLDRNDWEEAEKAVVRSSKKTFIDGAKERGIVISSKEERECFGMRPVQI